MRDTIFISYCHKDRQWLDLFVNTLKVGVLRERYSIWSDKEIPKGKALNEDIEAHISAAKIALLLVTPDFLQSEYIATKELKLILDRHTRHGLELFWVPIKPVGDSMLNIAG